LTSLLIHGTLMLFHFTFFQNVTADDDNQDGFFSDEDYEYPSMNNSTDTDMEKQINATLLFPTVRSFFLLLTSLFIHGTLMLFHFTFFRPHHRFH